MKPSKLAPLVAVSLLALAWTVPVRADTAPAAASTTCKDGTTSNATGRGACSGHGGVQKSSASSSSSSSSASAPAATPPPASTPPAGSASAQTSPTTTKPASTPDAAKSSSTASSASAKPAAGAAPAGATAKCKDGTYSKSKTHSGTCSHHGGVDQWLDSSQ
jgi:hypothetical protein